MPDESVTIVDLLEVPSNDLAEGGLPVAHDDEPVVIEGSILLAEVPEDLCAVRGKPVACEGMLKADLGP